nr:uncharacterized protein LOC109023262 [Gorilla gorilla gorilla]
MDSGAIRFKSESTPISQSLSCSSSSRVLEARSLSGLEPRGHGPVMSQGGVTAGTNPDPQRGILPAASDHRLPGRWLTTAASRRAPGKPNGRTARANERPVRSREERDLPRVF